MMKTLSGSEYRAKASERAVVGTLLWCNRNHAVQVFAQMVEDDFTDRISRMVFRAGKRLYDAEMPIDPILIIDSLEKGKEITAEDVTKITGLDQWVINPNNITHHIGHVLKAARERLAKNAIREAAQSAANPLDVLRDLQGATERLITSDAEKRKSLHSGSDTIRETFQDIIARVENPRRGLLTGIGGIDSATGGFVGGNLVIIAARPSVGKSASYAQIVRHALDSGLHVFDVAYEQSADEIMRRHIAAKTRLWMDKIRDGKLTQKQIEHMHEVCGQMSRDWADRYTVYDGMDGDPEILLAQVRMANARASRPVDLVAIDYLQLMHIRGYRQENRNQEIGVISGGLKKLARELNIPVIALSQLSREPKQGKKSPPQLSDLRDSGCLEQDADIVIFLHRTAEACPENGEIAQITFMVSKNRNGPLATVPTTFHGATMTFREIEEHVR